MIRIILDSMPDEIESVRILMRKYHAYLFLNLCFQGFNEEIRGLRGDYAPDRGRLLLAVDECETVGGVAHCLLPEACWPEMKHLFVRSVARGSCVGSGHWCVGYLRLCLLHWL